MATNDNINLIPSAGVYPLNNLRTDNITIEVFEKTDGFYISTGIDNVDIPTLQTTTQTPVDRVVAHLRTLLEQAGNGQLTHSPYFFTAEHWDIPFVANLREVVMSLVPDNFDELDDQGKIEAARSYVTNINLILDAVARELTKDKYSDIDNFSDINLSVMRRLDFFAIEGVNQTMASLSSVGEGYESSVEALVHHPELGYVVNATMTDLKDDGILLDDLEHSSGSRFAAYRPFEQMNYFVKIVEDEELGSRTIQPDEKVESLIADIFPWIDKEIPKVVIVEDPSYVYRGTTTGRTDARVGSINIENIKTKNNTSSISDVIEEVNVVATNEYVGLAIDTAFLDREFETTSTEFTLFLNTDLDITFTDSNSKQLNYPSVNNRPNLQLFEFIGDAFNIILEDNTDNMYAVYEKLSLRNPIGQYDLTKDTIYSYFDQQGFSEDDINYLKSIEKDLNALEQFVEAKIAELNLNADTFNSDLQDYMKFFVQHLVNHMQTASLEEITQDS